MFITNATLLNRNWLSKNVDPARKKLHECWPVREEIKRLREDICQKLGVKDVVWDCGWGTRHFRGCLQSFRAMAADHPECMYVLKGKCQLLISRRKYIALGSTPKLTFVPFVPCRPHCGFRKRHWSELRRSRYLVQWGSACKLAGFDKKGSFA